MAKEITVSRAGIIKFKISYDAEKLAKKLPDMIHSFVKDYAEATGEGAKKNIFLGNVKPDIEDDTKRIRRSRKKLGSPPLLASGALIKSIKVKQLKTKTHLKMKNYGWLHHKGFDTDSKSMIPNKKVKARPFIKPLKGEFTKIFNRFKKDLKKNFKKKRK